MEKSKVLMPTLLVALLCGCASGPPRVPQAAAEPGMLVIRGGRFTMGRDSGEINERPAHTVEVREFAIDRTEVPAAEFAEFLNASGNPDDVYFTPDEHATVIVVPDADGKRVPRFAARPGFGRHPANNVSWYGADAYCRWREKRLPTEAEWEKAARGTDRRPYPWGTHAPGTDDARFGQTWEQRQLNVLVPVDALPGGASPYGLLNMAGNVLEWVSDWYRQNYCNFCDPYGEPNLDLARQLADHDRDTAPGSPDGGVASGGRSRQMPPRINPSGPSTGGFRVLKGGSWQDLLSNDLRTTRRFWLDPSQRFPHTGFRCSK